MKRVTMWIGGALLGLVWAQAMPTAAQAYRPYDPGNPNSPYRRPRTQPYNIEVPPAPLLPNSSGLLERDFEQMRRTSPNPNAFMGGRWNPGHITVYPSTSFYNPGWGYGYGGGYYPYGGYYGGVVLPSPYLSGTLYGSGYGPYGGYAGGLGGGYGGVSNYNYNVVPPAVTVNPTTPPEASTTARSRTGDDYYLRGNRSAESLSDALDDIRKAWVNGDLGRLQARVPADGKVRISAGGEYRYTLDGREFTNMLKDAMKRIDTVSFELDRPTSTDRSRARVTGRHTYVGPDGARETVPVSYALELANGRWVITEAGSGSAAPSPRGD